VGNLLTMLRKVYEECYACDFCGIVGHPGSDGHTADCELRKTVEAPGFPEDINDLREELFAASRRLGRLKQEFARRQREARIKMSEEFAKALRHAMNNPDLKIQNDKGDPR